jgi:hypothetical protein
VIDPGKEREEDFITIRCLDLEDKPEDLPEIVDQVWECCYLEEPFSFIFTTVYGWTNAWEVARPGSTPETWAHWQDQYAALDRLLVDLANADLLPEAMIKQSNNFYVDALVRDVSEEDSEEDSEEEDRDIFSELSAIFKAESENIRSFVEDDKIPSQTVLVFLEAIKRKVAELILMHLDQEDEDDDGGDTSFYSVTLLLDDDDDDEDEDEDE